MKRIFTLARQLEYDDLSKNTATAFRRWRRGDLRCLRCSHGARMTPVIYMDVYRCRWGHNVTGLELHRLRRSA